MSDLVKAALATIVDGGSLSMDEARAAMGDVMDGEATPAQLAALLMGLRMRGETVDELAGFAAAMRDRVVAVDAPRARSTSSGPAATAAARSISRPTAALVAAAAGIPVAKHGNRAITSKSGAADVLDALGVRIDHDATSAGMSLRSLGFAFLFAPVFHPAMRHAGPTRKEIGVRTAFNLLGPLTNPARTRRRRDRGGRSRGGGQGSRGGAPARDGADLRHPRGRRRRAPARWERGHPRRDPGRHRVADRRGRSARPALCPDRRLAGAAPATTPG